MNDKEKYLQEIIDEMEEFVADGKPARFSPGKIILEEDILVTMLEELRSHVPMEVERSHQIMQSKQDIIDEAKTKADAIVNNAIKEASEIVEEHEIVQLAKRRAADIEAQSNQYAEDLVSKARAEAKEIRVNAIEYTKDMMNGMAGYMGSLKKAQTAIYTQLLDGITEEIADIEGNISEVEGQLYAIMNRPVPKARTMEDFKKTDK